MIGLGDGRRLFTVTLYDNGNVSFAGRMPKTGKNGVAESLRIMAEAIDAGAFQLSEVEPAAAGDEGDDRTHRQEQDADGQAQRQDVEQAQDSDEDQDERDDQGDEVHD